MSMPLKGKHHLPHHHQHHTQQQQQPHHNQPLPPPQQHQHHQQQQHHHQLVVNVNVNQPGIAHTQPYNAVVTSNAPRFLPNAVFWIGKQS
ncbi:uncharacterized protein [Prorops nasuta]|uniref:uncharacterized protein n=1 Tax=Prorops nasuta TaxID=863751 RepID=UPI0034CD098A